MHRINCETQTQKVTQNTTQKDEMYSKNVTALVNKKVYFVNRLQKIRAVCRQIDSPIKRYKAQALNVNKK